MGGLFFSQHRSSVVGTKKTRLRDDIYETQNQN